MKKFIFKISLKLLSFLTFSSKLFTRIIRIIFSRIFLRIYSIDLNVPKWHLNATYEARAYKNKVIKLCNSFQTNNVIEIGCGIGEIISRLKAPLKYGLDVNKETLMLCKRINKNVKTIQTDIIANNNDLLEIMLSIDKDQTILLVMVNWLHDYSESKVLKMLNKIFLIDRKIILIADIYQRKELSRVSNNKITHEFIKIKNNKYYRRLNNIDKVRDIAIISNFNLYQN